MGTRRASAFESDDIDLTGFGPKTGHEKGAPLEAIRAIAEQPDDDYPAPTDDWEKIRK